MCCSHRRCDVVVNKLELIRAEVNIYSPPQTLMTYVLAAGVTLFSVGVKYA